LASHFSTLNPWGQWQQEG